MNDLTFFDLEKIADDVNTIEQNVVQQKKENILAETENGIVITEEFIEQGISERGGFNQCQINLLGEKYPPLSGWKKKLIGKVISKEDAQLFIELKGMNKPTAIKLLKEKKVFRLLK